MRHYSVRFFNETDEEVVEIEAKDSNERQDKIDALWEENDREQRFDGVEW